jgi:hypothetical protein
VPWDSPIFTPSDRVGQAAGPAGAAGVLAGAEAAGLVLPGTLGTAVTVTVAPGPAAELEAAPQAVLSTAMQASAAPAAIRREVRGADVIGWFFLTGRLREPGDS